MSTRLRLLIIALLIWLGISPLTAQTWEVYDLQGNLKSLAIYDQIKVLSETVITAKDKNGLSMLSRDLKPMVDLQGEEVFQYLAPWILVKGPNGLGAFHEYGLLAFPLEYEEIQTYFNFVVGRKGKDYWLFDKGTGKTIALGTWESCKITKNGMLIAQKDGGYFLPMTKNPGRKYQLIEENEGNYLLTQESTGYGILNFEGDYVMEPLIDQLEHTQGDYFYGFDENQYLLIKGDHLQSDVSYNSYHKITKEGDLLLEYIHGKLRRIMENDGILLDAVGMEAVQVVGPSQYSVLFRDSTLGLLGKKGWLVQPTEGLDWIKPGSEGMYPAGKNGKTGFVNASGKWIIEAQFDETGNFHEQIAPIRMAGNWGMVAMDGRVIAEPKWDEIKDFQAGIAVVKASEQYFLLDKSGQLLTPDGFSQVCRLKEGYFLVEREGKRGLLDQSGKEVLAIAFDNIQVEKTNFFIVTQGGLTGVLNDRGDVLYPINYQEIVADWSGNQILVKALYEPVVIIQPEESTHGKRKKGA